MRWILFVLLLVCFVLIMYVSLFKYNKKINEYESSDLEKMYVETKKFLRDLMILTIISTIIIIILIVISL